MRIFDYDERTTHVGFADEAYWNVGDFRSVACVSARADDYPEIEQRLCMARCRAEAIASEIKWQSLRNNARQRDADSVLKTIIELADEEKLRVDVFIWNNLDRLTLVQNRSKDEGHAIWNLRIMYQKLFGSIINRWQAIDDLVEPFWTFAIDKHEELNQRRLERDVNRYEVPPGGNTQVNIREAKPTLNYSVQLADLFAGMGAYSHSNCEDYDIWMQQEMPQDFSFEASKWRNRFPVINAFTELCDEGQGVFLLERKPGWHGRGLWTMDPDNVQNTINFLPYTLVS